MYKWGPSLSVIIGYCSCGDPQTVDHIVDLCPISKFEGGLTIL